MHLAIIQQQPTPHSNICHQLILRILMLVQAVVTMVSMAVTVMFSLLALLREQSVASVDAARTARARTLLAEQLRLLQEGRPLTLPVNALAVRPKTQNPYPGRPCRGRTAWMLFALFRSPLLDECHMAGRLMFVSVRCNCDRPRSQDEPLGHAAMYIWRGYHKLLHWKQAGSIPRVCVCRCAGEH